VPAQPTQLGPHGIRYDFNEGCRVQVPAGNFRVQLRDLDTASILFDQSGSDGQVISAKRYYLRFGIEVWRDGISVFRHEYNATGKNVLARMEAGGLGDQIAWLGHAVAFARKHGCRLTCAMKPAVFPLFRGAYPEVRFLTAAEIDPTEFYATYKLFIFYNDHQNDWQPYDYRQVGLCHTAAYILGVPPQDVKPEIVVEPGPPPITEPYVCIATQATSQNKYWNNAGGWTEIVVFLKAHGYRVICIDQKPIEFKSRVTNQIPYGAEDETGDRPLTERARWLRHAAFFVGLSSGLSWLAWAAGCPVVMISGFTHPMNEFHTPYRVSNVNVCNSCSNDTKLQLDPTDFLFCPRHKNTARMFECTRLISAEQVKATIRTIPGFGLFGNQGLAVSGLRPKTLIFCTSFSQDGGESRAEWDARYRRWLDTIMQSNLELGGVLIVDDGSRVLPNWQDVRIIHEGEPLATSAAVNIYHFNDNLGRRGMHDIPGWFRSFTFAAAFADANGFDKVILIESDASLLSEDLQRRVNQYRDGWLGFWYTNSNWPETGIQVIAGAGMDKFRKFSALSYTMFTGRSLETLIPFTEVDRTFNDHRPRENIDRLPEDAD
jgi:autotransporter strand-loop-strand O-heptosyltransferase